MSHFFHDKVSLFRPPGDGWRSALRCGWIVLTLLMCNQGRSQLWFQNIPNQFVLTNSPVVEIPVFIEDWQTGSEVVINSAHSSRQDVVSDSNIEFLGAGKEQVMRVIAARKEGTTRITLTATNRYNELGQISFGLSVLPSIAPVFIPDPQLERSIRYELNSLGWKMTNSQLSNLDMVQVGHISGYSITNLSGLEYAFNLEFLGLSGGGVTNLASLAGLAQLQHLIIMANPIKDLAPISGLTNLLSLELTGNQIRDFSPINNFLSLRSLGITGNPITNFTGLALFTNLTQLSFDYQGYAESDLVRLTNLDSLALYGNAPRNLAVLTNLTRLTELRVPNCKIEDFAPLVGLPKLTWLIAWGNPVADIASVTCLTNLVDLSLSNCGLTNIAGISNLTRLRNLHLDGNRIPDLTLLKTLTNLHFVDLSRSGLKDLSNFGNLSHVIYLALRQNSISDISPLAGMTNLENLVVDKNEISDISSLAGLNQLRWFFASQNQLTNIDTLLSWTNLSSVRVAGNPLDLWPDVPAGAVIKELRRRGVSVDCDPERYVRFLETSRNPDGSVRYRARGPNHISSFSLQVSTNLNDWSNLGNLDAVNGIMEFDDKESNAHFRRFYRVLLP